MTFLAVKGFGDFTILASYLLAQDVKHTIIVRAGLNEISRNYLGDRHSLILLKNTSNVLGIYDLRRIRLANIFGLIFSLIELRRVIKKTGKTILLDDDSLRNRIIFLGINRKYLSKKENIYQSYSKFFSCSPAKIFTGSIPDQVAVFPFGSTELKSIDFSKIDEILKRNSLCNKNISIYAHVTDVSKIKIEHRERVLILKNLSEIIDVVKKAEVVVAVDTFQLHLAFLYNKRVIPMGVINDRFKPSTIED